MLVESETSCETSNSAHLDNQTSGVSLPASIQEEQEILRDFLSANIDTDDYFGDTGVCANCNREPKEGSGLKRCARCHITRYCSTDCQRKDWDFSNSPALSLPKGLQQRLSYVDLSFSGLVEFFFFLFIFSNTGMCCDTVYT